MVKRAPRGLLIAFLIPALAGGTAALCLALGLCALPETVEVGGPAEECHETPKSDEEENGVRLPTVEPVRDLCCSQAPEWIEAKIERRSSGSQWRVAPGATAARGLDRPVGLDADRVDRASPWTAAARPAFVLHDALLL